MGLLDDAIREHLELKRRRGADPSEVERMEEEALGPPQRGEFVEAPPAAPAAYDEPFEPAPDEQPPEPPPLPGEADEPPLEPEEAAEPWFDEPAEELEREPAPEPEPAQAAPQQPTREFAPGEAPDEEDVLEETPDFLQETPEHDRLWFEQKPPRDFDLDR